MLTYLELAKGGLLRVAMFLAIAVAVATSPATARKRAQPMPTEDVATTWIGLSETERIVIRLQLDPDWAGSGAYTFLDEEARIFSVSSWQYEAGEIRIEPLPEEEPSWVRTMRGQIVGETMHLRAADEDWEVVLVLRQEKELVDRWAKLKDTMTGLQALP